MASLAIDDAGTLTTSPGGTDLVFYLQAPDLTYWKVTVAASDGGMAWVSSVPGTPVGWTVPSATKWWEFSIANDGTLSWNETAAPATVEAESAVSLEGCAGAATAVAAC